MTKLNLKQIRKRRRMTQKDFAKLLGISQNYLSEIECGKKKPSIALMDEFASILNYSTIKPLIKSK